MTAFVVLLVFLFSGASNFGKLSEVLPGTYQRETHQLKSPDQSSVAAFWHKESHGMALPPEPPKILERWARLKITKAGKTIYDSSYENLNTYQHSFALDAIWSPDSNHLTYRFVDTLRTIGPDGKMMIHDLSAEDSVISSFRWIDNESLIIVSKKMESPLSSSETPYRCYPSYCENAVDIRITRLSLTKGKAALYSLPTQATPFLFHALDFFLEEISPAATRVAFSDGSHLCIYDIAAKEITYKVEIPQKTPATPATPAKPEDYPPEILESIKSISVLPQQLEGLWWKSDDELIVGVGLLGSYSKSFYTYHIPTKQLTDVTSLLLPIWDGSDEAKNYRDSNWYRTTIR